MPKLHLISIEKYFFICAYMTHDNKNYIVIHQYFIFISVFENTYLQLEKQF